MKKLIAILFVCIMVLGLAGCGIIASEIAGEFEEEGADITVEDVSFAEIYAEKKANELRANEEYNDKWFRITGTINGIESGGLLNITGGATLTMEIKVDTTTVYFLAEFESEQEDALMKYSEGDVITFVGKYAYGMFEDCRVD